MNNILLIEDDYSISMAVSEVLQKEGYKVHNANDGETGYELGLKDNYDLIILDLILPFKNGLEICKDLRENKIFTPILMVTSKSDEIDKLIGLELGADDYLTKPFSIKELLARIKCLLRRHNVYENKITSYSFDEIKMNIAKQEIFRNDEPIKCTVKEFNLLKYMIEHEGEVITRDRLLDDIWGYDSFPTTRTVDNYILSLRKKIESDPSKPKHILTIPTAGYKFVK